MLMVNQARRRGRSTIFVSPSSMALSVPSIAIPKTTAPQSDQSAAPMGPTDATFPCSNGPENASCRTRDGSQNGLAARLIAQ
jgi:hypothetical protein